MTHPCRKPARGDGSADLREIPPLLILSLFVLCAEARSLSSQRPHEEDGNQLAICCRSCGSWQWFEPPNLSEVYALPGSFLGGQELDYCRKAPLEGHASYLTRCCL